MQSDAMDTVKHGVEVVAGAALATLPFWTHFAEALTGIGQPFVLACGMIISGSGAWAIVRKWPWVRRLLGLKAIEA